MQEDLGLKFLFNILAMSETKPSTWMSNILKNPKLKVSFIVLLLVIFCCFCCAITSIIGYFLPPTFELVSPSNITSESYEPNQTIAFDCTGIDKIKLNAVEVNREDQRAICSRNGYTVNLKDGENVFEFVGIGTNSSEVTIKLTITFDEGKYQQALIEEKELQEQRILLERQAEIDKHGADVYETKQQFQEKLNNGVFAVELLIGKNRDQVSYIVDDLLKPGNCLTSSWGNKDLRGNWRGMDTCIFFSSEDNLPFIFGFEKYTDYEGEFCADHFNAHKTDRELSLELTEVDPLDYCEPQGNYAEHNNCRGPIYRISINCYESDFNMTFSLVERSLMN